MLHNPREIGEGIFVYGFCFKDVQEKYGDAYPVYVPDGGVCKSFERKKAEKEDYEYEMTQEFKCECCKKNSDWENIEYYKKFKVGRLSE